MKGLVCHSLRYYIHVACNKIWCMYNVCICMYVCMYECMIVKELFKVFS